MKPSLALSLFRCCGVGSSPKHLARCLDPVAYPLLPCPPLPPCPIPAQLRALYGVELPLLQQHAQVDEDRGLLAGARRDRLEAVHHLLGAQQALHARKGKGEQVRQGCAMQARIRLQARQARPCREVHGRPN